MTPASPVQNIPVHRASEFRVVFGANLGDSLSVHDDLAFDDVYMLNVGAKRARLALETDQRGRFFVADGTTLGRVGAPLHLDCAVALMSDQGQTTDALVLVELDAQDHIAEIYLLPFSMLDPEREYRIVGLDPDGARQKFAQLACVSFTRGTHITIASGAQVMIEDLRVGDRVLTRDDGPQTVRWIGQSTVRAVGDFAPIAIKAGALNNENDLIVSPDHRLFVYQRSDRIGVGTSEILVKARHLVNGETVVVREGGFVDYFQILFDRHHIIYAEGIAAESLLINPRTRPALPADLLDRLSGVLPGHSAAGAHGLDVQKALLERPDAIELLRRASLR